MAETRGYLICDRCGHMLPADAEPETFRCDDCGYDAGWFFTLDKRNAAETHAAHIAARHDKARG